MNLISIILSVSGLIAFIVAALLKGDEIKKNLFFVFAGSVLTGTGYLFEAAGLNGAVSAYIGGAQAIINYFFNAKKKPIPVWLTLVYAGLFLFMNLAVLDSPVGILALLASLCFVGCVSAKSGKGYRVWQMLNSLLWISYDLLSHSYGPLVTHSVLFLFTLFGALINDYKKTPAQKNSDN